MKDILSQLVRKPSKATDLEIKITRWDEHQARVLEYLENDQVLQKILGDFRSANDHLKQIRSTRQETSIYYTDIEKAGVKYTYARCVFVINGKRREFRKYIGKAEDIDIDKVNEGNLRKFFSNRLKKFLE
jgi:hypothetical protein